VKLGHRHNFVPSASRTRRVRDQAVVGHAHFEICTGCGARQNVVQLPPDLECGLPWCPTTHPLPPPGVAA
jgi:hypothetical protein